MLPGGPDFVEMASLILQSAPTRTVLVPARLYHAPQLVNILTFCFLEVVRVGLPQITLGRLQSVSLNVGHPVKEGDDQFPDEFGEPKSLAGADLKAQTAAILGKAWIVVHIGDVGDSLLFHDSLGLPASLDDRRPRVELRGLK